MWSMAGVWETVRVWLDQANAWAGPLAERIDLARNAPIIIVVGGFIGVVWRLISLVLGSRRRAREQARDDETRAAALSAEAGVGALREEFADIKRALAELTPHERAEYERLKAARDTAQLQSGAGAALPEGEVIRALVALSRADHPAKRQARERVARGDVRAAAAGLVAFAREQAKVAGDAKAEMDKNAAETFREAGALSAAVSVTDAVDAYREAARLDPDDFETHINLRRLAMAANDLSTATAAAKAAAAAARSPRERAVALVETGDVLRAANHLDGALERYQEALKLDRELARQHPEQAQHERDISVNLQRIGAVLHARNDLPGAHKVYEEALRIDRQWVQNHPDDLKRVRDVGVGLDGLGDVRATQGDLPGARTHFEDALSIARDLAKRDPMNIDRARDVSVSLNKVGDILMAGRDFNGALERYQESLVQERSVAKNDPSHADNARDVTVSLIKVGDALEKLNKRTDAVDHYGQALSIRQSLAAQAPTNVERARDVWVALWRLARYGDVSWSDLVADMESCRERGLFDPAQDQALLDRARAQAKKPARVG